MARKSSAPKTGGTVPAGFGPKATKFPILPDQELRNHFTKQDWSGKVPGHDFRSVDDAPIFDRRPVRGGKQG